MATVTNASDAPATSASLPRSRVPSGSRLATAGAGPPSSRLEDGHAPPSSQIHRHSARRAPPRRTWRSRSPPHDGCARSGRRPRIRGYATNTAYIPNEDQQADPPCREVASWTARQPPARRRDRQSAAPARLPPGEREQNRESHDVGPTTAGMRLASNATASTAVASPTNSTAAAPRAALLVARATLRDADPTSLRAGSRRRGKRDGAPRAPAVDAPPATITDAATIAGACSALDRTQRDGARASDSTASVASLATGQRHSRLSATKSTNRCPTRPR